MVKKIQTQRRALDDEDIKRLVETLQSELSGSRDTISALLKSADQILAIGATILVSVALVSLRKSTEGVVSFVTLAPIFAPLIFGILLSYWIRVRTAVNSLGGYKAALEECLVTAAGDRDIRLWESGGAENMKARIGYRLNMFLNVLAFLTSVGLAAFKAEEIGSAPSPIFVYGLTINYCLVVAYWTLLALLVAALAFAFRDSTKAFRETRAHTRQTLPVTLRSQTEDDVATGDSG